MATYLKVVKLDDPPVPAAEWIVHVDDKILACRGQGHAFPKIRTGSLPKGMRAVRQHDGSFQITFICRDCGTERTLTTLPTGNLDLPAKYKYKHPPGYKTPKGSSISRRECLAESWRRTMEAL